MEIALVRDGTIIMSIPIDDPDLIDINTKQQVEDFFNVMNGRKVRTLFELMREGEMGFTDLLNSIDDEFLNPKLVYDCIKPLQKKKLVIHAPGKEYRLSDEGAQFAGMFAGFVKMIDTFLGLDFSAEQEVHAQNGPGHKPARPSRTKEVISND